MATVPGMPLQNTSVASGQSPTGEIVDDDSDSGTNPNTSNPGGSGDMGTSDDPTPLILPDINVAKHQSAVPLQVATNRDQFEVPYTLLLENTGNVTLSGIDLYDDVSAQFGGAFVLVSTSPTVVSTTVANAADVPSINPAWDTNTALSIFNDDGTVAPGETVTIEFTVRVDSTAITAGGVTNQTQVVADNPMSGDEAGPSDLSDSGGNPQGTNPGQPGDTGTSDDPTPLLIPDATVGVAKDSVWDDANDTAIFNFYLENFGNEEASNLSMPENLDNIFVLEITV